MNVRQNPLSPWAAAIAAIIASQASERADALQRYSREVGRYVPGGLSNEQAFDLLWQAAVANGFVGEKGGFAVEAIIRKGLQEGMSAPAAAPDIIRPTQAPSAGSPEDVAAPAAGPPNEKAAEINPAAHIQKPITLPSAMLNIPALNEKCEAVRRLRLNLLGQGFVPVAVATRGKSPVRSGWPTREGGDAHTPVTPDALNTGIRCAGLRVVDIDVDDAARSGKVRELAFSMLGSVPMRRRENSSRVTLPYRAAVGEPKKLAITSTTFKGAEGKYEKVEVLGQGQQFVAYGTHPTGAELRWEPNGPEGFACNELTAVTEERMAAFLFEAAKIIDAPPRAPTHPPTQPSPPVSPTKGNGQAGAPALLRKATPMDAERAAGKLRRLLEAIKTHPPGDRSDWLNKECHTLGGFIGSGCLQYGPVFNAVAQATCDAGWLEQSKTEGTVRSGLTAGMARPMLPENKVFEESGPVAPARVGAVKVSMERHLAKLAQE